MPKPYPLNWIPRKPRTPAHYRKKSQFTVDFVKARDDLLSELKKLRASKIVISCNVPTRQDGLPYAKFKKPDDPGVVLYFRSFKKEYALGCDCYLKVRDNLRAIGLHIKALRDIERYGVSSVEEIFQPFLLPTASPTYQSGGQNDTFSMWWTVLNISPNATVEEIKQAYKKLSLTHHPDAGGDRNQWERLSKAYQEALNNIESTPV